MSRQHFSPETLSPADLESKAGEVLPTAVFDFARGFAGTERIGEANRSAFDRYVFWPKILSGNHFEGAAVDLFGRKLAAPFCIAPMGGMSMYHPEGELAVAKAVGSLGLAMSVSTASSISIESLAADTKADLMFQLYWQDDMRVNLDLVQRAESAGCLAVMITVDWMGRPLRRRDLRNGFRRPDSVPFAMLERYGTVSRTVESYGDLAIADLDTATPDLGTEATGSVTAVRGRPSWPDVAMLCQRSNIPVVLKGILRAQDAVAAMDIGAAGVVVSNHGGRYLDRLVAPLDVLQSIVGAIDGRGVVLFDSGVRSGEDAAIALGLGAHAVLLGRPVLWALAIDGERGVGALLRSLMMELESTLELLGVTSLGDLREGIVGEA